MKARILRVLCGAAVVAALLTPTTAQAVPVDLTHATWHTFSWFDGTGPIDSPADGYWLTAVGPMLVRVVDCCITGDAFDVYLNTGLVLSTPSVPAGIATPAFDGDTAWATPGLSKGSFLVGPGVHDIDIIVRELAGPAILAGSGFIRADRVPEPMSALLFGLGMAGLAVARRRKA